LIRTPENLEAINLAIRLVAGDEQTPRVSEEIVLAFKSGQEYIESLVARQRLATSAKVALSEEAQFEVDTLLLRGAV
jgi:hypothetical protein